MYGLVGRRSLVAFVATLIAFIGVLHAVPSLAASSWQRDKFVVFGNGIGDPTADSRYNLINGAGIDILFPDDSSLAYNTTIRDKLVLLRQNSNFTLQAFAHLGYRSTWDHFTSNTNVSCKTKPPGGAYDVKSLMNQVLQQPVFSESDAEFPGLFVWDEPGYNDATCGTGCFDFQSFDCFVHADSTIDFINHGYGGQAPVSDRLEYVNLLPIHSDDVQSYQPCTGINYAERFQCYLERYLKLYDGESEPAPVLSVDSYPFQHGNPDPNPQCDALGDLARQNYFVGLKVQRDMALKYSRPGKRIPTWLWVQISQRQVDPCAGPAISDEQIRWQVYSALSYGMKGIGYWTLYPRPDVGGQYGAGILKADGTANQPRYDFVTGLNAVLHAWGPTLAKLDPVVTLHNSFEDQLGLGSDDDLTNPNRLYNVVRSITEGGVTAAKAMVSHFKHQDTGDDYILVMNKDLATTRTFRVYLAPDTTTSYLKEVSKVNGSLMNVTFVLPAAYFETTLLPGEGRLYKLTDAAFEYVPNVNVIKQSGTRTYYGHQRGLLMVDYATGWRVNVQEGSPTLVPFVDLEIAGNTVYAVRKYTTIGTVVDYDLDLKRLTHTCGDNSAGPPVAITKTPTGLLLAHKKPDNSAGKINVLDNNLNILSSCASDLRPNDVEMVGSAKFAVAHEGGVRLYPSTLCGTPLDAATELPVVDLAVSSSSIFMAVRGPTSGRVERRSTDLLTLQGTWLGSSPTDVPPVADVELNPAATTLVAACLANAGIPKKFSIITVPSWTMVQINYKRVPGTNSPRASLLNNDNSGLLATDEGVWRINSSGGTYVLGPNSEGPPPAEFALVISPNPSSTETVLRFTLPSRQKVRVAVFDLLGREVATLADGQANAGPQEFRWKPALGRHGVYLFSVQTESGRHTRKFVAME